MSLPRKFGRRRPVARGPVLRLSRYVRRALPAPPITVDYGSRASDALRRIYLNDQLGCCVVSGLAHVEGVLTGNACPAPIVYTDPQIEGLYSAIGGYVPGDPSTDQGCDVQTALAYWQNHGLLNGSKPIAGWLAVDPTDLHEVRVALWLFENLIFGVELPDSWIDTTDGAVWDADEPNPENGHCFVGYAYDNQNNVIVDTWGERRLVTPAAMARNVVASAHGELYAVLSPDSIAKASAKAPSGFAWADLVADFDAIGGHVPIPVPQPPAPPPIPHVPPIVPPSPSTSPSRAQVLSAVTHAVNALPWPDPQPAGPPVETKPKPHLPTTPRQRLQGKR